MRIEATWDTGSSSPASDAFDRGAAAIAASLAIPLLEPDAAAQLALEEGLVTHLTSLILVDEDSATEAVVPATRKVALPSPRTSRLAGMKMVRLWNATIAGDEPIPPSAPPAREPAPAFDLDIAPGHLERLRSPFAVLGARIDWDREPGRLQVGDISSLEPDVAELLQFCAEAPEIAEYAKAIGVAALVLVVALLARSRAETSRSARRITNAILRDQNPDELDRLMDMLNVRVRYRL
jgi:hypothetical protein